MTIQLSTFDSSLSYPQQKQFDCGHATINSFVRKNLKPQAKQGLSVAYVLTDSSQNDRFVGFYTIVNHKIDVALLSTLELGSLPHSIPCSRIVMLGVDKEYKGQQLGARLMKHAFAVSKAISKQSGSFGVYLDADPNAIGFYQKLGFVLLEGDKSPAPSPMFIPMSSIP